MLNSVRRDTFALDFGGEALATHPATTVKVVSVEPHGETKVRIMMEMIVDVHRLAEVGSDLLRTSIEQVKATRRAQKKK